MGDKPQLGAEAGQHEILVGGKATEHDLPVHYTRTACVGWAICVTLLFVLLALVPRAVWYGLVWGAIGLAMLMGGIAAISGRIYDVHPFWGGVVAVLAAVAGWLWDQDGWALVHGPVRLWWAGTAWLFLVFAGWLVIILNLTTAFTIQTSDRNYPPTRDKVPGEIPPLSILTAFGLPWPKGRYEDPEPLPAPAAGEPVRVVSVGWVDRDPHLERLGAGVQRSNGNGGSGRQNEVRATASQFEAVRRVLLDVNGDLRNGGYLDEKVLGCGNVWKSEEFRQWRGQMEAAGLVGRESAHPKAPYIITEAGQRFLAVRGWE